MKLNLKVKLNLLGDQKERENRKGIIKTMLNK